MMQYKDLDIHGRINLKSTYAAFVKYGVEHFQKSQDKHIYNRRISGKRSLKERRTRHLQNSFKGSFDMSGNKHTINFEMELYGRFVDMGVGRGVNKTTATLRQRYRDHKDETPRTPKKWYSKTKYREERAINEIMIREFQMEGLALVESILYTPNLYKAWQPKKKGRS